MNTINPHLSFINRAAGQAATPANAQAADEATAESLGQPPAEQADAVSLSEQTAPARVPLETLSLAAKVAGEMVPGLPGMALAIVNKSDVKEGRFQPEGGRAEVKLPDIKHLSVQESENPVIWVPAPVGEGWPEPEGSEAVILTGERDVRVGPSQSQDLGAAVAEAKLTGQGEVEISALVQMTTDDFHQIGNETMALIPKEQLQGNVYTAGAEAPVALEVTGSHFAKLETPAIFTAIETPDTSAPDYDGARQRVERFAMADAQARAFTQGALRENWVEGRLEERGLTVEGATDALRGNYYAGNASTAPEQLLLDKEQRKLLGAFTVLTSANVIADARQQLGQEAVEMAKVTQATGDAGRLINIEGEPAIDAASFEVLRPHLQVMLEQTKPIVRLEQAHARGQGTTLDNINVLDRALNGPKQRPADSPVNMLKMAALRATKMNSHLGDASKVNLRELKEQSEQVSGFLEGSSIIKKVVLGITQLAAGREAKNQVTELNAKMNAAVDQALEKAEEGDQALIDWLKEN